MAWIATALGFLARLKPLGGIISSAFSTIMAKEFGRTLFFCSLVWFVVQWQGCGAASDAYDNGYLDGLAECVNDVRPAPDDGGGWYPGKNFRRWIFGTDRAKPATIERWSTSASSETLEAPTEGQP